MYVITVYFKVHPEYVDDFIKAMKQQADDSLTREANCHYFDVCQSATDSTQIFLYEVYETEMDFQAHLKSEHFINFNHKTANWVAEKRVVPYLKL